MSKHFGYEDFAGMITVDHGPVSYLFQMIDGPTTGYFAGGSALFIGGRRAIARLFLPDEAGF